MVILYQVNPVLATVESVLGSRFSVLSARLFAATLYPSAFSLQPYLAYSGFVIWRDWILGTIWCP